METTIAVKESTVQLLMHLKQKLEARSLDETIVKIAIKSEDLPASRFGSQKGKLITFKESERATFHEL